MNANSLAQILIYLALLSVLAIPLGNFIAEVFRKTIKDEAPPLNKLESILSRLSGLELLSEMSWRGYCLAVVAFGTSGIVVLYLLQRLQQFFPLNPQNLPAVQPELAFNTAVSFVTNTNWQAYGGESTLSYFSQMAGLSVQNFLSAATGVAVLMALVRGLVRSGSRTIGNFWRDLVRGTLYLLLPLSFILALFLVSQGVIQTFAPYQRVELLDPIIDSAGAAIDHQMLALGPVASQVAIKQLGTNGGGFFNTNSAHPFENPTPLSNLAEMLAILLIPAALCHTFGVLVSDRRQGWALFACMLFLLVLFLFPCVYYEAQPNPPLEDLKVDPRSGTVQASGNMEGKEVRFGVVNSAIWAVATTAASNGSVNSMHDSYSPLGGMMPMILMQLGEVVFGGVGSGLYGLLAFVMLTVFISGLMVGRTPEYLGKRIETFEMKLISLVVLIPCALVLVGTACGVSSASGMASISNPGPHGFSEMLYAYSSMGNNNGSAFAGLNADVTLHKIIGAVAMFIGRFWLIFPILALGGSLGEKKKIPVSAGTLPTHTPLFIVLLSAVVLIVGALTFFPALALGPIAEHFQLLSAR